MLTNYLLGVYLVTVMFGSHSNNMIMCNNMITCLPVSCCGHVYVHV